MGAPTIVLFAALSLSVGMYSLGIQEADNQAQSTAADHADQTQLAQFAEGGVQLALQQLGWTEQVDALEVSGSGLFGGTVDYSVDINGLPDDQAKVTSVGTDNGYTATTVALLELVNTTNLGGGQIWYSWEIVSIWTTIKESDDWDLPLQ